MEYQKNLLDNAMYQSSNFRTSNWVEINDKSQGKYDSSFIRFKTSIIRSDLSGSIDAYIVVSVAITITGEGDDDTAKRADKGIKKIMLKNCAPFFECISSINNSHIVGA